MATHRITAEPAYVLHRYDWSETLLPLQPLHVAFGGDAEIKTLKAAEWQGGHVMPTGDSAARLHIGITWC
jgi:DNA repair protein RecO (recombination protein O)